MSDTPRVDKEVAEFDGLEIVPAPFARTLERELAQVTADLAYIASDEKRLCPEHVGFAEYVQNLVKERDALLADWEKLKPFGLGFDRRLSKMSDPVGITETLAYLRALYGAVPNTSGLETQVPDYEDETDLKERHYDARLEAEMDQEARGMDDMGFWDNDA